MNEEDLTLGAPEKRIRVIIDDESLQRVWLAAECLTRLLNSPWLHIDQIGTFLRERQLEADREQHDLRHPATMYALRRGSWCRDETVAAALSAALHERTRLLDLDMRDGQAWFRPVPYAEHGTYTVPHALAASLTWSPSWIANLTP